MLWWFLLMLAYGPIFSGSRDEKWKNWVRYEDQPIFQVTESHREDKKKQLTEIWGINHYTVTWIYWQLGIQVEVGTEHRDNDLCIRKTISCPLFTKGKEYILVIIAVKDVLKLWLHWFFLWWRENECSKFHLKKAFSICVCDIHILNLNMHIQKIFFCWEIRIFGMGNVKPSMMI